jgi:hypothetical protein
MYCFLLILSSCKKNIEKENSKNNLLEMSSVNENGEDDKFYKPLLLDALVSFSRIDSSEFMSVNLANGNIRTLKRINVGSGSRYKISTIVDTDLEKNHISYCYVINEDNISVNDLLEFSMSIGEVYLFTNIHGFVIANDNYGLTAHYNGVSFSAETTFEDLATRVAGSPTGLGDEPICIDWFWSTWDEETGLLIDEVFLFSNCSSSGGGGGGNGGSDDPSHTYTEIVVDKDFKWKVGPKVYWYTLNAYEYFRGIYYIGSPGAPPKSSIFTMAKPTGVVFAKKITANYTWSTEIHNTQHTTILGTCHVVGKLLFPGGDEQEIDDNTLVNPNNLWPH